MLADTTRITLQLSNMCPFAHLHPRCAAHELAKGPRQILPSATVIDVLDTLHEEWDPERPLTLAWHVYNEPGIDPRLVHFWKEAKKRLPFAKILFWTNAWYLTPEFAKELVSYGMDMLVTSPYFPGERERQSGIGEEVTQHGCRYRQTAGRFGDRMKWYLGPKPEMYMSCSAPLNDLTIRASGYIGLCCIDGMEEVKFANVNQLGFRKALTESWPEMKKIQTQLMNRQRELKFCKVCVRGRKPR